MGKRYDAIVMIPKEKKKQKHFKKNLLCLLTCLYFWVSSNKGVVKNYADQNAHKYRMGLSLLPHWYSVKNLLTSKLRTYITLLFMSS